MATTRYFSSKIDVLSSIAILSPLQWLDAQSHIGDSCLAPTMAGTVFCKPPGTLG
jgi:hypothetical protein